MMTSEGVRALLEEGVRERVFTQASVAVYQSGRLVLNEGTQNPDAVFDVASVTKVLTAVLALKDLSLDWALLAPAITTAQLLTHTSGLPAWRPFFAHAARALDVFPLRLIAEKPLQNRARKLVEQLIRETPADAPRPTYSDLNFLALGFVLEARSGLTLPDLGWEFIIDPLALGSAQWGGLRPEAVKTGNTRPRPGNPNVEPEVVASFSTIPGVRDSAVDDDNAAILGGATGHAGLWINARNLALIGDAIRRCAEGESDILLPPAKARLLFEKVQGSRTYGLDTPSGEEPSIGTILGRGPKGAAGHLGYTGCSLWMDRDAELSIAFLSNAVAIERPNPRIRAFRPKVHDLIAKTLLGSR
jgi:CubicO group peptidase (beta-lactamase class C family)